MKDSDRVVIAYNIMKYTRPYWPRDKKAIKIRTGEILDSSLCEDPQIMFPVVYYTREPEGSEN